MFEVAIRDEWVTVFMELQSLFTMNWDIVQKNGFHYHNLVFMLNLVLCKLKLVEGSVDSNDKIRLETWFAMRLQWFLSLFQATAYTFYSSDEQPFMNVNEDLDKSDTGDPKIKFIYNKLESNNVWNLNVSLLQDGEMEFTVNVNESWVALPFTKVPVGNAWVLYI